MATTKELHLKWLKEHPNCRKIYDKKYRESEKGKLAAERGYIKYRKTEKRKIAQYRYDSSAKGRASHKRYYNTDKGKISRKRVRAKHRKLGFIPLFSNPFDILEQIEWHHITDIYVVAVPKDLHQLYKTKQHREMCMTIVEQIYKGELLSV